MSASLTTAKGSPAPPWYAHVIIGAVVLAAGVALTIARPDDAAEGYALIGSGVTFLGVGSGVAANSTGAA